MRGYLGFLKGQMFWGFFIILGFGAVFSAKGAAVESKLTAAMDALPVSGVPGIDHPIMQGVIALAASRSMWLSYRFAAAGMLVGVLIWLVIEAAVYTVRRRRDKGH